jgi:hypothetical protein
MATEWNKTLKQVLTVQWAVLMTSSTAGYGPVFVSCERSSEHSDFLKKGNFLNS